MSRHAAAATARTAAPAGLAVTAFLLFMLAPTGWPGLLLAGLSVLVILVTHRRPVLGVDVAVRLVLATGVLAYATRSPDPAGVTPLAVTGAGLLGVILAEPLLHRLARPWYAVAQLPARPGLAARLIDNGGVWLANSVGLLLTGLLALIAAPGWLLPAPALALVGLAGWLVVDGVRRWRTAHRDELAALTRAITQHQPRFLLYFGAPPGSEYQAKMWLPYLAQLAEPFLVVVAERHNLRAIAAATPAPVVVCETFEALDAVMVPSLRAAFYVNNGMKNAHCVRFSRLTHVQLYHGDSDKAVTASPLNQLFDRVFVAGQAAVDRFAAHGVTIPVDRFRIVGRPQVAQLQVREQPGPPADVPVVLYAPTWVGAYADSNYCSLPIAAPIVEALLAWGATVILRPHPYSHRHRESAARLRAAEQLLARDHADTGRPHRWGRAATVEATLFDCMNQSDAMICDVSSVASEYLYTGKPFAITDMLGDGDRFIDSFPVARAAYVIHRDAGNLPAVLTDLLTHDPRRPARRELRTYYLGDIPPERYVSAFLDEARQCVSDQLRSGV